MCCWSIGTDIMNIMHAWCYLEISIDAECLGFIQECVEINSGVKLQRLENHFSGHTHRSHADALFSLRGSVHEEMALQLTGGLTGMFGLKHTKALMVITQLFNPFYMQYIIQQLSNGL